MTEIEFIYTSVKHRNITHLQGRLKPRFYDYLSDAVSPRFRELSGKQGHVHVYLVQSTR